MIRADLRLDSQARDIAGTFGQINDTDGSACVSQGQTTIRAMVTGPAQPKYQRHEHPDRATLDIDVSFLVAEPDNSRSHALRQYLQGIWAKCVALASFPRQLLQLQVVVVREDGALFSTALHACALALLDAAVPLLYLPVAVEAAALQGGRVLVDPTQAEAEGAAASLSFTFRAPSLPSQPLSLLGCEVQGQVGRGLGQQARGEVEAVARKAILFLRSQGERREGRRLSSS